MSNLKLALQHADKIENMLIDSGGEITPEIQLEMSINPATINELVDIRYISLEKIESATEFYEKKAEEFAKISSSLKSAHKFVLNSVKAYMIENTKTELVGNDYQFKLSTIAPVVEILDESELDEVYKKQELVISVDKRMIGDDLKKGIPVAGAVLKENYSLRRSIVKQKGKKKND